MKNLFLGLLYISFSFSMERDKEIKRLDELCMQVIATHKKVALSLSYVSYFTHDGLLSYTNQEKLRKLLNSQNNILKEVYFENIPKEIGEIYLHVYFYLNYYSIEGREMIAADTGIPLRGLVTFISPNLLLERKDDHVIIYDLSLQKKLKNFFEEKIPLRQLLLLRAIAHAKEQNSCLHLTQEAQQVFDELLPEIQAVARKYVAFCERSCHIL